MLMYICMYVRYVHSNILGMMVINNRCVCSNIASPMAASRFVVAHNVIPDSL